MDSKGKKKQRPINHSEDDYDEEEDRHLRSRSRPKKKKKSPRFGHDHYSDDP